ncbi:DUF1471 domain-containing protein [Enterobacter mori]|uniref:DUF1471 domain-containing protein n=1 Tax=Enterobacter mori TaxID=539813 RepID=UPI001B8AE76D|nr:DUF1471 domain-containing protein [Enterobacter mori]MBS3049713.1 DUF1471 domain-containing protein [Enterobacter mori]
MNMNPYIITFLMSVISSSTLAAMEISKANESMTDIGHVSVTGKSTAEAAVASLKEKAENADADFFRVNRLTTPGDGSNWSANAILYKNK